MNDIKMIIDAVFDYLGIEFTLWGYTFSFWSIIVWMLLASLVIWIIHKIFGGVNE